MTEQMREPIPPGWYEPPAKPGLLAYWDGTDWDTSVPPQPASMAKALSPNANRASSGLQTLGWLCAFLFPVTGFVIGCIVIAKGPEREGWLITLVSVAVGFFGIMVLSGTATY